MKSVLFLAPDFMDYSRLIENKLLEKGFRVDHHVNGSSVDETIFKKVKIKFFIKVLVHIFLKIKILHNLRDKNLKKIWDEKVKIFKDSYDYVFVVKGDSTYKNFYKDLKIKYPYAKFINYQYDDLKKLIFPPSYWGDNFDRVVVYNFEDSKKYGYEFMPIFYLNYQDENEKSDKIYDLFFIGTNHNNRIKDLQQIIKANVGYDIKYFLISKDVFRCINFIRYSRKQRNLISYNRITYKEYIEFLRKSRAVFDLSIKNQLGLTTRVVEGLFNNVKIITTNKRIKDYSFYSSDNIYILDDFSKKIPEEFLRSEFVPIKPEIKKMYELDSWLEFFFKD